MADGTWRMGAWRGRTERLGGMPSNGLSSVMERATSWCGRRGRGPALRNDHSLYAIRHNAITPYAPVPRATRHEPCTVHAALGALVLAGCLAAPAPLMAQLLVEARVGATVTSDLVEDVIVDEITVAPRVAPSVAVAIGTRLDANHAVAVDGGWSRSDLESRAAGDATRVLALTVWTASVSIRRRLIGDLWARGTIGALKYAPAGDEREGTLFQEEAPLRPMVGIGARYERGLTSALAVGVDVGWDLHRFTTQSLRADGFDGESTVHRLTVAVTVGRRHDRARP